MKRKQEEWRSLAHLERGPSPKRLLKMKKEKEKRVLRVVHVTEEKQTDILWPRIQRMLFLPCLLLLLSVSGWSQTPTIFLGTDADAGAQCHCLNNATTLDNGQFADTVTIVSAPGETWMLTSNTGAFSEASAAPPAAPILLATGQVLPEVSSGVYRLIIRHVDAQGFAVGFDNGSATLNISNTCYYPNIAFLGLPDTICLTSNPVMLLAQNNGIAGVGAFAIESQPATIFNAQILGAGTYTVTYTFDALTGTPGNPNDPGCVSVISKEVVVPDQPNTAVIAVVNVTLGQDCEAVITPEMMLSGNYPCLDDFIITVFDQNGIAIGNTVNGTHAGERLNVRVMSEAGQFIGDGQIDVFDVDAPSISCPPGNSMPQIANDVQLLNGSLPNTSPLFIPNNFACYSTAVAPMSGQHYYSLREITVDETDVYTIELNMDLPNGGVFGIYQGSFNAFQGPCQGIVGVGEPLPDGEGYYTTVDAVTRLHVMLTPGMPYTLLTMGYDGNQLANYQYAIYSVGTGRVNGFSSVPATIQLPLYCSSVPGLINNPASVDLLGAPVVNDACMLNPPVTFTDQFVNGGNCGTSTINRTFTVTDQAGNSNQCIQQINFSAITMADVNFPPKTFNIPCDATYPAAPNGNPSPSLTGYPFVITAGGVFNIAPVYCNMLASFEDFTPVASCTGTDVFVRRWTVFDDCGNTALVQFDQTIIIGDRTGPVISCPAPDSDMNGLPDTLVYGTQGASCTGTLEVPLPNVTDNCSGWTVRTEVVTQLQVPILNPFGQVIGFTTQTSVFATIPPNGSRIVPNVPVGTHFFRFIATDDCGNTAQTECPFRISDFAIPTAACDDLIHISLGGDGVGVITAQDIDEGSSDNCGPVSLQVRRAIDFNPANCNATAPSVTPWGPFVNLYCCEVGDTVTVNLLVTDIVGNFNTCSGQVVVRDNTAPVCLAPQPVTINCSELPEGADLENTSVLTALFGSVQAIDACQGALTAEFTPQVNIQNCGLGSIIRQFQVSDVAGNTSSCQQVINITTNTNYEIKFPRDVIGNCAEPGADTLIINNFGCDNFAVNTTDQRFNVVNGACYKIMRTYSIINWCEYDGFSTPVDVPRNAACQAEGGMQDVWVIRAPNGTTYLDADNNQNNGFPAAGTRPTTCDGLSNPAGYWGTIQGNGSWTYTQVIKVIDTTAPVITAPAPAPFCTTNNACQGGVNISFSITDGCAASPPTLTIAIDLFNTGQFTTSATLTGTFPNYQVSGTYPIGSHRLRITANDSCGNSGSKTVDFTVVDCSAAGFVCNSSMAVPLMPQLPGVDADGDGDDDLAAAAVTAEMFLASVGEDCSDPLRYTIHRVDQLANGSDVPFPNHPALVVTCDELGFIPVRIYQWDSAFNPTAVQPDGTVGGPNYTTCDALLQVQDNNGLCGTANVMGTVSGLIITEEGVPVSGVEVSPREDMAYDMMMTESDGLYDFELTTQEGYNIQPYSADDYMNGVSTIDIIYISKHILGVDLLDSPYKMIAADINHSNTITTLDLVHLRKAILGITQGFPNNESWRFVDAAYNFPNPANPWEQVFPETVGIPMLNNNVYGADFIAVKIGDINGNVHANLNDGGEERAVGNTYYLRTEEQEFEAGETIEAVFTAADLADEVQGFQFTLQFDPGLMVLENIEWSQIQPAHVNQEQAARGILTISWDASQTEQYLSQEEMTFFILRFKAQTDGRLSESIGITSRMLPAEAYGLDDSLREIGLNFAPAAKSADGFFLEQNRPNPFGDQTIIGFQIPEGGQVTLTIYDTNGKVVRAYQQYYTAGYNQILVDAQDIAARGLLYYKLETDQYAATKKMVILE